MLGALRVLGRGMCFDGIAELTDTSEEVHRTFFHQFTAVSIAFIQAHMSDTVASISLSPRLPMQSRSYRGRTRAAGCILRDDLPAAV